MCVWVCIDENGYVCFSEYVCVPVWLCVCAYVSLGVGGGMCKFVGS